MSIPSVSMRNRVWGPNLLLKANVIPDFPAKHPIVLLSDPSSRRPSGDPPGLKHDDIRLGRGQDSGTHDGRRKPGSLAGAGLGDENQGGIAVQRLDDAGEARVYWKEGHGGHSR